MSATKVASTIPDGAAEAKTHEQNYARRITFLFLILVITLIGIEGLSRFAYRHMSRKQEIEAEVRDSLAIQSGSGNRVQVLFAGNSLVKEGTDTRALQKSLGDGFEVHRAGIPGSSYEDWSHGIRSLLARGSQPQIIVFGVSPAQLVQDRPATLLPATRLWNVPETVAYYLQRNRNLTELSNLLIARYSTFFYLREQFRTDIRGEFPGFEQLANQWMAVKPSYSKARAAENNDMLSAARRRLEDLRLACEQHQAKLVYLIVPTRQADDTALEATVKQAASEAHVPVIEPVGENEWPAEDFADGYHLTHTAAVHFSELIGENLAGLHLVQTITNSRSMLLPFSR